MSYRTNFDQYSANLLSRFFALIIDGLILLVPSFILMLPALYFSLKSSPESGKQLIYIQLSSVFVSLMTSFYRPLYFHFKGMTPGMKAMGLRITNLDNSTPSIYESLKREFPNLLHVWVSAISVLVGMMIFGHEISGRLLLFSLIPWVSTLFWIINNCFIIFSSNNTSLGDRWAKTIMVQNGQIQGH